MPFTSTFSNEDLLDFFSEFGPEISSKEVSLASDKFGVQKQSITSRLKKIPHASRIGGISSGKWKLTVEEGREILEKSIEQPAVEPAVQDRNLVPQKDPNYVPLVTSLILRGLLILRSFIQHSLLDYLVMVKHYQ